MTTRGSLSTSFFALTILMSCGARTGFSDPIDMGLDAATDSAAPPADGAPPDARLDTRPDRDAALPDVTPSSDCVVGAPPIVLARTSSAGLRLTVDDARVYWTELGGEVRTISKTGDALQDIAVGQAFPLGIAVDETHVYWTNRDGGTLQRATKSGGESETLWVGNESDWPFAVVVDPTHAYWITYREGAVYKILKGGGDLEMLAVSGARVLQPVEIAQDDRYVFWTDMWSGTLYRIPKEGGNPYSILSVHPQPRGLALDDEYAYYTTPTGGRVARVPKMDGEWTWVTIDQNNPVSLAVDESSVYFANTLGPDGLGKGDVRKVAKEGGDAVVLAAEQDSPDGVTTDATCVYWVTSTMVMKVAKN